MPGHVQIRFPVSPLPTSAQKCSLRSDPAVAQKSLAALCQEHHARSSSLTRHQPICAGVLPDREARAGTFHEEGRPSTSLGLGLFIAREITEAHGGKITAKSAEGLGAIFTIEIPKKTQVMT
jgi:hypothetical protein